MQKVLGLCLVVILLCSCAPARRPPKVRPYGGRARIAPVIVDIFTSGELMVNGTRVSENKLLRKLNSLVPRAKRSSTLVVLKVRRQVNRSVVDRVLHLLAKGGYQNTSVAIRD